VEKNLTERLENLRASHPEANIEVWAEDEARLGLKPILRRVWAPRGQRPLAESAHRYAWLYLFGFVEPASGRSSWWILPTVRTSLMSEVLAHFAKEVGAGRNKQILLVLDQASWHMSKKLELPEGLHLQALPSHTPELQPAEHLWPLVREALANEGFASLADLEERVSQRCQILGADVSLIKAHTHFHWWPVTECTLS
jgi:hypothetical protein